MPGEFTAFPIDNTDGWTIEPAPVRRDWMDNTTQSFANRCLPLVIANQIGWVVRLGRGFEAKWGGKIDTASMSVKFAEKGPKTVERQVSGHFGHGVLTFVLPWLFRTPKGVGLLVRGVPNQPIENALPLEGFVETDWAPYPFTMNWKITGRNKSVWFRPGDIVCTLTPMSVAAMESLTPRIGDLNEEPELKKQFTEFEKSRGKILEENKQRFMNREEDPHRWQLNYMRGKNPFGAQFDQHKTNLKLGKFDQPESGG